MLSFESTLLLHLLLFFLPNTRTQGIKTQPSGLKRAAVEFHRFSFDIGPPAGNQQELFEHGGAAVVIHGQTVTYSRQLQCQLSLCTHTCLS